ncbi:MAG TPA: 50S ribosomal protein L4 [Alphaproteobacteria bacterium]|nr:50S ribosomal protein L4 [Alphaproteobacteria bacterium]
MKAQLINLENKVVGEVDLLDDIFAQPIRKDILHEMVNWQLAKRRQGTQSTKTRSEVTGSTKKPWKQKGTGNARQGSMKGPHMVGGGVAHAPAPRSYEYKLNKKFRIKGLKTALSLKASEGNLKIVDTTVIDGQVKTKDIASKLKKLGVNKALIVRGDSRQDGFVLAVSNIKFVDVIPQNGLNVYDILRHDTLVVTNHALNELQNRLK